MKPEILIRADGNPLIGLGHLVRCSALAHMLKDDFNITFICKNIPDPMLAKLNNNGFNCCKIEIENEFISRLNDNTIAVLDGYHFDIGYQKQVKATGSKLVCIDDLHDKEFLADLIINHAPGITIQDYKAQPYTQFALGLDFALLRPAFLKQAKKERKIDKIETVLICFGGSDYYNLTDSTLRVIMGFGQFRKIIVVTGSAYKHVDSLNAMIKADHRIVCHHDLDSKQMISLMVESSLAIVPCSSILLELFTVGVPTITGFYVDNQREASKTICEIGLALNCENMFLNYNEKLNSHLDTISCLNGNQMVQKQKAIIWKGSKVYLKLFKSIYNEVFK